jgi:hypothetical protein
MDLTGRQTGLLTAIRCTRKDYRGKWLWLCQCRCGTQLEVAAYNLQRSNGITSCGCTNKSDKNIHDLTGQVFGKLTVMGRGGYVRSGPRLTLAWLCECKCGRTKRVRTGNLQSGGSTSCGHCRQTKHLGSTKRGSGSTYDSWWAAKQRCRPNHPNPKTRRNYGDRGITMCDRWSNRETGFTSFLADMGERPPGTTLDRYPDPNGNYEPDNCRWATPDQQQSNRRVTRRLFINGHSKLLAEVALESGLSARCIWGRIRKGTPPEIAISIPSLRPRSPVR